MPFCSASFDDVVEMIPITVNTSGVRLRQILTGRGRLPTVDIKEGAVHHLDENGIKSRYTAFLKIIFRALGSIQAFRQKPNRYLPT